MNPLYQLNRYLSSCVTEERLFQFNRVLDYRTRYITLALEDIYQPQNASAVLRTCDCFGIQDIHIIENYNTFNVDTEVALGAHKWVSFHHYNSLKQNTLSTIHHLKKQGYRIVATTPHSKDVMLDQFDLNSGKVALFFGTELNGLSKIVLEHADEFLKIPMFGFTESFNISVSAAVILHHLTQKLHQSTLDWRLSDNEKELILFDWLCKTIKRSDLIVASYCEKNQIDLSQFI